MGERLTRDLPIVNERGLHARAAGNVVQLCETFDAEIVIRFNGETADAESMMDLLSLAASKGSVVTAEATGADADAALDALDALFANRFGEEK